MNILKTPLTPQPVQNHWVTRYHALNSLLPTSIIFKAWYRPILARPLPLLCAFDGTPWDDVPSYAIPLSAWIAAAHAGPAARPYLNSLFASAPPALD
jgi:hypothetical protein